MPFTSFQIPLKGALYGHPVMFEGVSYLIIVILGGYKLMFRCILSNTLWDIL